MAYDPSRPAPHRPAPLQPGDRVAVIAPSSAFDRKRFERGVEALLSLRLEPAFGQGLFSRWPHDTGYLAGDDARRGAELNGALHDRAARAIVMARGGYGIQRLLGQLAAAEVASARKLLCGYSDATVLHELWAQAGVPSIHGPMCTQLGEDPSALERFRALLFGGEPGPIAWEALHPQGARGGKAEGVLRGGNLAMLASMCGTSVQPRFQGCLVLLEDLNEPPYRLDRLVTQLLLSGALEGARGVVIGDLWGEGESPAGRAETVAERLSSLGVPVVFGAPFGHAGRNQPVAFGCAHALDADEGRLVPLESPTAPAVA